MDRAIMVILVLALASCASTEDKHQWAFDLLGHGLNLPEWSICGPDGIPFRQDKMELAFSRMQEVGFRHVRVSLVFPTFWTDEGEWTEEGAEHLDRIVRCGLDHELVVVIDPHLHRPKIEEEQGRKSLYRIWDNLSKRYSTWPEDVVYELLNEPRVYVPAVWQEIAQECVETIRRNDKDHAIVVPSIGADSPYEMPTLKPVSDRKAIYTFHFYQPAAFTHQGAGWSPKPYPSLKGVRYPTPVEMVLKVQEQLPFRMKMVLPEASERSPWNKQWVARQMQNAIDWAREHDVPLYCGEFGCYRLRSRREDRLQWTKDVVEILNDSKLPWAMWEYAGGFGIFEPEDYGPEGKYDRELLTILGMEVPE